MAKRPTYASRIRRLEKRLGSQRAVAREIGISSSVLRRRMTHPESVRYEHELALDALEQKLSGSN